MRLVAVLVGFVLCAAACTGAQAETPALQTQPVAALPAPTATEVPPTATAVPEPTSTPEPTATAVPAATPEPEPTATPRPAPTVDPADAVGDALLTFQTQRNGLIMSEDGQGFMQFIADHAWPPGEWNAEMAECMVVNWNATFRSFKPGFYNMATLVHSPDWVAPASNAPGAGQPTGANTWAVVRESGIAKAQHYFVLDGERAYLVVDGDPTC